MPRGSKLARAESHARAGLRAARAKGRSIRDPGAYVYGNRAVVKLRRKAAAKAARSSTRRKR
jgi:hypothetical protein